MKNYRIRVFITAFAQVILAGSTYAQGSNPGSPATLALTNSKLNYNKQIDYQSRLFNGVKYVEYEAGFTGNAYYQGSEFQNANLHYDGVDFYSVPILYDLYKQMVVVKYPADQSYMSLINNKLDMFSIGSHTFIRIDADSKQKDIETGFYELLYNGKSQFVKKHTKDIQVEKSGLNIQNIFYEHTSYFLLKDGIYYPVSGKRSMLNVFKDKKKDLDAYIKANKIDFNDNQEEEGMIKVATYYDQLSK